MRPEVTEALTLAFFNKSARAGYSDLNLERVVRSAGVGKAALYRRWPEEAVTASDLPSGLGVTITNVGEEGSLEKDLEAALLPFAGFFAIRLLSGSCWIFTPRLIEPQRPNRRYVRSSVRGRTESRL